MLPSALLLVPFFFAPLAIMLVYSFHRFVPGGRQEPAFILDNYWRFVSDLSTGRSSATRSSWERR